MLPSQEHSGDGDPEPSHSLRKIVGTFDHLRSRIIGVNDQLPVLHRQARIEKWRNDLIDIIVSVQIWPFRNRMDKVEAEDTPVNNDQPFSSWTVRFGLSDVLHRA
jgi:hypothetical protein